VIHVLRRWAFDAIDTAPMSALRVACGLLTLGWALSLIPDAQTFLGNDGLTSGPVTGTAGWWTLPVGSPYGACALLAVAAVALTVGWHTRVFSIVVAFLMVDLQRRNVYVLDSGDQLLRDLCIYVALMPAGETWSLDARHHEAQPRAPWAMRLLQIQVSVVYLFDVTSKLNGDTWQNGSAVGMLLQLGDLQRLAIPRVVTTSVAFSAILTYGTLVTESFLIVGLWFRKTRWWAIGAGLAMHLAIEATILTGWFSLAIISCYLAFVPGSALRRLMARGQRRIRIGRLWPRPAALPTHSSSEAVSAALVGGSSEG
jgi:hypothetical protein